MEDQIRRLVLMGSWYHHQRLESLTVFEFLCEFEENKENVL